jgi:hypothetical protein
VANETETVEVFVFSSDSITNIWAGYGSSTWAVSRGDEASAKAKATKSARLLPGSLGVLYCKPWKAFTVPFVTTTKPDKEKIEREIWHGEWMLPFGFKALGDPRMRITGDETYELLEGMKVRKINNFATYLNVQSNFDFQPSRIDRADWATLVERLVENA